MKLHLKDKHADYLDEAFGLSKKRDAEFREFIIDQVEELFGKEELEVPEVLKKITEFCDTLEEVVFATFMFSAYFERYRDKGLPELSNNKVLEA